MKKTPEQKEIERLRKDLKAATEVAEAYRRGQQNACDQLDAMTERAEAAEAKLAEAQKDTGRLTYLECEWASGDCPVMECDGNFFAPSSRVRTGGDLRAAIDAARRG